MTDERKTESATTKRRSLLYEAKAEFELFRGGGPLAQRIRDYVRRVYASLANRKSEEAAKLLTEAYEIVHRIEKVEDPVDYKLALNALDLGLFLWKFGESDEALREIGWRLWDARNDIRGDLYDYMWAANQYLDLIAEGVEPENAVWVVKDGTGFDLSKFVLGYETQGG